MHFTITFRIPLPHDSYLYLIESLMFNPRPPPPPGGLLCRPFWGGGPGVGLALFCFVVCSAGRFVVCLSVCHFVLVFFSPFSIAITSLGEERAHLSAFGTFFRFVLV